MNENKKKLHQRIKGDLYLVMQKDKFHKVFNKNLQPCKTITLKLINKNSQKQISPQKPKSTTQLKQIVKETDPTNLQTRKTQRKKSQEVSIVQDIQNHQKQHNDPKLIERQNKVINESAYGNFLQQNPQKIFSSKCTKQTKKQINLIQLQQTSALEKYRNFKGFFQFILDFKLMNIGSYTPKKKQDDFFDNMNSIMFSPRTKKSTKSLKVHFQHNGFQEDQNQFSNQNIQKEKTKQKNHDKIQSLQDSERSFVNVHVSDVSLQDQILNDKKPPTIISQRQMGNIKQQKKICFEHLNPNQTSLDEINPVDSIDQNQKICQNLQKSTNRIVSLQELKNRIKKAQQEAKNYVHHGYFCDDCKIDPIIGRRYKCVECQDYDLCEKCYQNECNNFRSLMNKYKKNENSSGISKFIFGHLAEMSPMMKKKMSDIKQEENPSQNYSSEEGVLVTSQKDTLQNEHVHVMEEVIKARPQFQQNLEKVLKQSTRCTNQFLLNSKQRNSQKQSRYLEPLTPQLHKHKIFQDSRFPSSKIAFSERSIPLRISQKFQRGIFESQKAKVQEIKTSTSQLKNLFT